MEEERQKKKKAHASQKNEHSHKHLQSLCWNHRNLPAPPSQTDREEIMELFSKQRNSLCSSPEDRSYARVSEETPSCSPRYPNGSPAQRSRPLHLQRRGMCERGRWDWAPRADTADLSREVVWAQENHKGNKNLPGERREKQKRN